MCLLCWIPGKKEKGPTSEEAIQKLKESEKILIKEQEFLKQKIQQEVQMAKTHGTKNKRDNVKSADREGPGRKQGLLPLMFRVWAGSAVLQASRRKKRLKQQPAQTNGTLSTLEFQHEATEKDTTNAEMFRIMELAAHGMKSVYQDMWV